MNWRACVIRNMGRMTRSIFHRRREFCKRHYPMRHDHGKLFTSLSEISISRPCRYSLYPTASSLIASNFGSCRLGCSSVFSTSLGASLSISLRFETTLLSSAMTNYCRVEEGSSTEKVAPISVAMGSGTSGRPVSYTRC
ncbi:hypothetical protein K458DRAFT_364 [Lentithecium fluviatile CBS 122367]|uniref:Uncharacterized protein n=1 Tax=Lentithecium fluviatile CBS 122367 TaxID=1168545 RepID=A0A6G1JMP1_9PLEO|nr:hypothetical protein K458DRAFT_364 [Lentithecium fluviatile CBS 122367]